MKLKELFETVTTAGSIAGFRSPVGNPNTMIRRLGITKCTVPRLQYARDRKAPLLKTIEQRKP